MTYTNLYFLFPQGGTHSYIHTQGHGSVGTWNANTPHDTTGGNAPDGIIELNRPNPCSNLDNGSGTITLPPEGCEYLSPAQVHTAIDGLPPGTELIISAIHRDFICNGGAPLEQCTTPGGNLGGNIETFDSTLRLEITGTGALSDFSRIIDVPAPVEIHTAPVTPGEPVQEFDTEIVSLVGTAIPDLDFASLTLTAGVDEDPALGSPGHTTLTQSGGEFAVDSFFDVSYEIAFVGAPGGSLDGLSGATAGTLAMATPPEPTPVPATSNATIVALGMLLFSGGVVLIRRRGLAA